VKTLSEHSKTLLLLKIKDHVFVQNGNAPGKWDCDWTQRSRL